VAENHTYVQGEVKEKNGVVWEMDKGSLTQILEYTKDNMQSNE
jgi:hypothetical protein